MHGTRPCSMGLSAVVDMTLRMNGESYLSLNIYPGVRMRANRRMIFWPATLF